MQRVVFTSDTLVTQIYLFCGKVQRTQSRTLLPRQRGELVLTDRPRVPGGVNHRSLPAGSAAAISDRAGRASARTSPRGRGGAARTARSYFFTKFRVTFGKTPTELSCSDEVFHPLPAALGVRASTGLTAGLHSSLRTGLRPERQCPDRGPGGPGHPGAVLRVRPPASSPRRRAVTCPPRVPLRRTAAPCSPREVFSSRKAGSALSPSGAAPAAE